MKKFLGVTMAAVCALTMASFGFSACGSEEELGADIVSDKVTAEEWALALSSDNALNVTINATYTYSDKETGADGTVETETESETIEAKLGITVSDESGISGNTYFCKNESYSYTNSADESENESYTGTYTRYEAVTANSYSCVYKTVYSDDDDDYWYGWKGDSYYIFFGDAYNMVSEYIYYADMYSDFEYSDGAYRYTTTYENGTLEICNFVIKITDGCVSYFSVEIIDTYNGIYYSSESVEKYVYVYTDYGTTGVTVPEEYTYEYYNANK